MTSEVLFETRGPILIITFNRPDKRNILTPLMAKSLAEKLKAISEDRGVRAILLRGAGDHFMDGHEMNFPISDPNAFQDVLFQKVHHLYAAIREFQTMERPVIAAIDGRVSGAGFSFMLACDLVIATKRAVFNAGFLPYAAVPDGGSTFFLSRKVGAARAAEMFMLSDDISADTAENWGLINKCVENDSLEKEAFAWIERLASGPTRILGATKRLISKAFEQDLNAHLSFEAATWTIGSKTFDFREAIKAIGANREPKYTGS